MSSRPDARARVCALLHAASVLVLHRARHVAELADQTGLSPQGVDLALTKSLEVSATSAQLDALLSCVTEAAQVSVVLSANVFTAALRALALALASSSRVTVKVSRREPLFPRLLLTYLRDTCEPVAAMVRLGEDAEISAIREGVIHAYGRKETLEAICASATVPVWAHGPGFGIAELSLSREPPECDELDAFAASLAEDIALFDQRGCLSPRVVWAPPEHTESFAEALSLALADAQLRMPRGVLTSEERVEIARYKQSIRAVGRGFEGPGHFVGLAETAWLPPPGRTVHVCPKNQATIGWLQSMGAFVTALGSDCPRRSTLIAHLPHVRHSLLGAMQRPPLDGPVDLRTYCPA
jgi:Acyl-CoA reductase (LuxC)